MESVNTDITVVTVIIDAIKSASPPNCFDKIYAVLAHGRPL